MPPMQVRHSEQLGGDSCDLLTDGDVRCVKSESVLITIGGKSKRANKQQKLLATISFVETCFWLRVLCFFPCSSHLVYTCVLFPCQVPCLPQTYLKLLSLACFCLFSLLFAHLIFSTVLMLLRSRNNFTLCEAAD